MTVIVRNPVIAAFDFDGTLVKGDSFFHFLRFVTPRIAFPFLMLRSLPALIGYATGRLDNETAKARIVKIFLAGRPVDSLRSAAAQFGQRWIAKRLKPEAAARLRHHQKQGHHCVLVSATLALYLEPWARDAGFDAVIATELAADGGRRLTGDFATPNCHGPEKARRLQASYGVSRIHAAYGDTVGDREMLAMADHPGYRLWR